jgi:curved DNA-binding protein CbpA
MNPWTLLGLNDDADERAVKRQYAKLLKVTRPDDDPEAFQRLREAYERVLDWARNRPDEDDQYSPTLAEGPALERSLKTAMPAHSPSDIVQPAQDADTLARQAARQLVEQTTAHNLTHQHRLAVEQGCDLLFQQRLLDRCLEVDSSDCDLLKAAIQELQWLTPWQSLRISADREIQLTQRLLDNEGVSLEHALTEGKERQFLGALQELTQQPWLASLERRDQLQRWVMFFLHNHKGWSAALFDRVCELFGWDDRKGVFPEPEFIWRHLVERCEKYAYIEHWQRLLAGAKTDSVEEKAARLVLQPGRKVDRLRLARYCNADVWIACERLCSTINHRYPEMLEAFPEADLHSWRTLRVEPMNAAVWTWIGWMLFTALFMIPNEMMKGPLDGVKAAVMLLMYPLFMTGLCLFAMRVWRPVCLAIEEADEWISDLLLPEWLHWPASQALLVRHGVPLVLIGVILHSQGPAAQLCYSLLMLAWVFLSPYRHPQVYAPIREAVKTFLHVNARKIFLSIVVIAAFAIYASLNPPITKPAPTHHSGQTAQALPGQLDCSSEQAMALMDKECKNAVLPERCADYSREQKVSQCWRLRTRLQRELGIQATQGQ